MNKQTGLVTGTILFFIASVITFLAQAFTSIVVARSLGPEYKGIYSLTLYSSSLVIVFFSLGLNPAISYLTASKKFSPSQLFTLSTIAGLLLSVVGGSIFWLAYQYFLVDNILAGTDARLIAWAMLGLPLTLVASFLGSVLLGQQRMVAVNTVNVLRVLANLVFQLVSSALSAGVTGAVLAWLSANGLALLVTLWFMRDEISLRIDRSWRRLIPESLSYGGRSYVGNLLQFFNLRLDSFLVNAYQGAAAVGQYTTSVTGAELLWYVPNSVSGALFPKVSTVDRNTANRLTPQACRLSLLIVLLAAIAFAPLGSLMLVVLYGVAYQPAVIPFLLLLPGMTGVTVQKIISADLSGRGKPQYAAYTAGLTVCVTIILDILLIPRISISGAAIASSIAYLMGGGLAIFWYCWETRTVPQELLIPKQADFTILKDRLRGFIQRSLIIVKNLKGTS